MKRKILILTLLFSLFGLCTAQEAEKSGFLLHNRLYRAHSQFSKEHYKKSADIYERLYTKDLLNDIEKGDYAEVLINLHETEKAEAILDQIPVRTLHEDELLIRAAMYNGNYNKAEELMLSHPELEILDMSILNHQSIEDYIADIKYHDHYAVSQVGFNSEDADFSPVVLDDVIYFCSERGTRHIFKGQYRWKGEPYLKLYTANTDEEVKKADKVFNTGYHDGPICFNSTGDVAFVTQNNYQFTNFGNKKADINSLLIHMGTKDEKGRWGNFKPTPFGDAAYSCTHPFLTKDDATLYFVSDMPGGYGGTDIYYVTFDGENFGEPVNMGPSINTSQNEFFPFWGDDGRFYFSSTGYAGFGGVDIYVAQKQSSEFTVANMGYPINSVNDDFSFFLNSDNEGYLASNREGGMGDDDIYKFKIMKPVVFLLDIKAKVIDKKTLLPLSEANVMLSDNEDMESSEAISDNEGFVNMSVLSTSDSLCFEVKEYDGYKPFKTTVPYDRDLYVLPLEKSDIGIYGYVYDERTGDKLENVHIHVVYESIEEKDLLSLDGDYRQSLADNKEYDIVVTKTGYFPYEVRVYTVEFDGWEEYNIPLSDMFEIQDIHYEFDKWNITSTASAKLDKVIEYMLKYPDMTISLEAHTDARGARYYNQSLSEKRAYAAKKYLFTRGIRPERISIKGFGEDRLKNKCADGVWCSPTQHQENRRTEIHITID